MPFVRDVVAGTMALLRAPEFVLPGLAISIAANVAVTASGWPGPDALVPTYQALLTMMLAILGRAWLLLSLAAVGLAVLRGERAGLLHNWVPVTTALEVGVVSIVLGVAICAGTVALVIPGVYLLLLWSQSAVTIVDGQARFFGAANWSASLTDGYRWEIAGIWAVVFAVFLAIDTAGAKIGAIPGGLPAPVLIGIGWIWRASEAVFGVALAVAMYLELSSRAPWQPELERVAPGADARVDAVMRAQH